MSNEIIPTGNTPQGLTFWQNRQLNKIETEGLVRAGASVVRHKNTLLDKELGHIETLQDFRHAEERGIAAIEGTNRVIDHAIAAVGGNEFKSHHLSKIIDRVATNMAQQV